MSIWLNGGLTTSDNRKASVFISIPISKTPVCLWATLTGPPPSFSVGLREIGCYQAGCMRWLISANMSNTSEAWAAFVPAFNHMELFVLMQETFKFFWLFQSSYLLFQHFTPIHLMKSRMDKILIRLIVNICHSLVLQMLVCKSNNVWFVQ